MDAGTHTLTSVPDGFCWKPSRHPYTLPTGLFLHGEQVASMQQLVDGSWLAKLSPEDGGHAPLLLRPCSLFDAGRRGCELWALRHEKALWRKVAVKRRWLQGNVVLRGRGKLFDPPLLTFSETRRVDAASAEEIRDLALPTADVDKYRATYRYFPNFVEAEVS